MPDDDSAALLSLLAAGDRPAPLDRPLPGPCVEISGHALPLALQLGQDGDGRLICIGLLVGWGDTPVEVTARALRSFRLAEILESVAALHEPIAATLVADARPVAATPSGGETDYGRVVAVYREELVLHPGTPVKHAAVRLHASPATVHRWLARARDRGLLERRSRRGPR